MPPPPTPTIKDQNISDTENGEIKKRLDTPLAAMLPSKYANVDVTELFPDFRHGKVNENFFIFFFCFNKNIYLGASFFSPLRSWQA